MTLRVATAVAAYRNLAERLSTEWEVVAHLRAMTQRETEQYYQAVMRNRDALRRAEEESDWALT